MKEVVKKEVIKLLDAGIIYPIYDSPWVSPIQVVPKKGGMTVVRNEKNELIPQRTVTGWIVMSFGLCNAPATFQRCMMAIFHELIKDNMEVFMDDFSVFGSSFDHCLSNLDKMLTRCEETNLVLNWEKFHFMVKEGIVLGHKISRAGIEDAKFDFYDECVEAFETLKKELTKAPIMVKPYWSLPFELMCDSSDYALEFDIEIRDKKGAKNLADDHLYHLENHETEELIEAEIDDRFPDESIMKIDFGLEEPDQIFRRCVFGQEAKQILHHCHHGPAGGHHGANATTRKVFKCGFY
ncbi:reverse transcriptase domain-containing protein [Tanacetum coccineum]